jgi:hypothetical protein
LIADHVASLLFVSSPVHGPAYVTQLPKIPFLEPPSKNPRDSSPVSPILGLTLGKIDLHIRIPAAFPGPGWGKIGGKNRHDLRAFGGGYTRCKSAIFWQTGQL